MSNAELTVVSVRQRKTEPTVVVFFFVGVDGMGASSEAEGLVLQKDSWVAGMGEHSRW